MFEELKKRVLDSGKKKVFILEDDKNIIDLLQSVLEDDFDLVIESNGSKVISKLLLSPPDVILLDIRVPGLDGREVLELIKKRESLREIPVIMMTALADKPTVIECLKLGAVDYVVKPFDLTQLKNKICHATKD